VCVTLTTVAGAGKVKLIQTATLYDAERMLTW